MWMQGFKCQIIFECAPSSSTGHFGLCIQHHRSEDYFFQRSVVYYMIDNLELNYDEQHKAAFEEAFERTNLKNNRSGSPGWGP